MPSYKHRSLDEYGVINYVLLGLRYQHLLFYTSIRHHLTPPCLRIFFRSLPFTSLSLSLSSAQATPLLQQAQQRTAAMPSSHATTPSHALGMG